MENKAATKRTRNNFIPEVLQLVFRSWQVFRLVSAFLTPSQAMVLSGYDFQKYIKKLTAAGTASVLNRIPILKFPPLSSKANTTIGTNVDRNFQTAKYFSILNY